MSESTVTTPSELTRDTVDAMADLVERVINLSREIQSRAYRDESVVRLTSSEGQIMRYLDRHPGSSPSEVADASGYQRSNLSAVLKTLESKGFVTRRVAPDDSRHIRLDPTPIAAENLIRLRREWAEAVNEALDGDDRGLLTALALISRLDDGMTQHRA